MMRVTVSGRQPCAVVQSTSSPTKSHKTHNDRCSGEWQEHQGRWLVVVVGHGLLGCALQQLFSCRHRCRRCCAWMGRLLHTIQSRTNKRSRKGSTVELDAVDHGLHHICLAGGTHERDTKGMGECSNTLQGHNNNFFFCCGGVIH